jgi:hypothetical protein
MGKKAGKSDDRVSDERTSEPLKIDLSTFILSLSTSALYQLGVMEGPGGGKLETPNRMLAQQTIDTLEMLQERTRGNLDEDEVKLFDSLLYELRMRFVSAGE